MSDFQSLLKELETVLEHTAVSHYTIVLTFPAEVEYFWGSPRSFVKGLFFWNRYFIFPVIAYLSFSPQDLTSHSGNQPSSDSLVVSRGKLLGLFSRLYALEGRKVSTSFASVIMQLRVHALYGQNRTLKIIVTLLFVMAVCSELGIAIAKLVTDTVSVQPIPFLVDPLSLCVETIPKFLIVYPVPMMTFDTIMLILVVYKAYLIQREETSATSDKTWTGARLMRIMFRDSVIYFANLYHTPSTVGVNLFNLLIWALAPYDLFTVGTAWAVTVPVMAASRILFNMRTEYHRAAPDEDNYPEIGTEFQVARRPQGSKGPTVWSSSSEDADATESGVDQI
ncbi:hypothetical protein C8R44DRAFT_724727 [Mycena epipterygia]|nr:hypothetical protein C8R44DRAFT_724727 [Mycena epipterygia]